MKKMNEKDRILLEAYLNESIDNIEISAGRILLDAKFELTKAEKNEIDDAKKAAKVFFNKKSKEIKELVCEKYRSDFLKTSKKADEGVALVGYIAGILASYSISVEPLNYIFISVWVVKNGIEKLCEEKKLEDQ